jgi:hypothetical protein
MPQRVTADADLILCSWTKNFAGQTAKAIAAEAKA